jgi:hypothetical protein
MMAHYATANGRLCDSGDSLDRITPDPRSVSCHLCMNDIYQWNGGNTALPGWTAYAVEPREKTMSVVLAGGGTTIAYPGDYLIRTSKGVIVTNSMGRTREPRRG